MKRVKRLLSCPGRQPGTTPRANLGDHAAVYRHGSRTEHEQGGFPSLRPTITMDA